MANAPRILSSSLLITLVVALLSACGARSELRTPRDAAFREVSLVDVTDDELPDVPVDVRRDVVRDVPPDVAATLDVVCPAPIHATQTTTSTLTAIATSNVGLPLAYRWTVERGPMDSMLAPSPNDQLTTSVTFDVGGEWILRFTANDTAGNTGTCTVHLIADPAIDVLCPQDQSNFQGATLNLAATARSRLGRTLRYQWSVESRPAGSTSMPTPADLLATRFNLDRLGDWQLRFVATDSAGLTGSCRVNLHADPDVVVTCPADTVSRPFATIALGARAMSRTGDALTYRWEIVDAPITSTASLTNANQLTAGFTFDVAGNWTYRFTATNTRGNFAYCTTRALAATDEAVRVEIVWNTDRSCRSCNSQGGGIDIDLHLANVALAQGHWASSAPDQGDCYYANCQCGQPGMLCEMENIDWSPVGRPNNPQQDVDHISDLPGPENINVREATIGTEFDVGVHYFGGQEATPIVARVYCAGSLVFESEAVRLAPGGAGSNGNPLWKVGRVAVSPGGCTFARCGSPGALTECIRGEGDW